MKQYIDSLVHVPVANGGGHAVYSTACVLPGRMARSPDFWRRGDKCGCWRNFRACRRQTWRRWRNPSRESCLLLAGGYMHVVHVAADGRSSLLNSSGHAGKARCPLRGCVKTALSSTVHPHIGVVSALWVSHKRPTGRYRYGFPAGPERFLRGRGAASSDARVCLDPCKFCK